MSSLDGALFALAFYLFLPFGVPASRAFQPEPLMVMTLIVSIYAILRYDRDPSTLNLLFAAGITAFAIIIKGVSAFPIGSMYGFLLLAKYGVRKSVTSPRVWMFTALSLTPALIFYGYQFFLADSLRGHLDKSFIPALYTNQDFWFGWLDILNKIFGFPILIAALVGILLLRDVTTKAVAFGLWVGYVVYGLITTRHIATHDYYSVPLIPIVALSLAPLAGLVLASLSNYLTNRAYRLAALGVIGLALALSIYSIRSQIVPNLGEDYAARAEAIGELVDHSDNIIYLSDYHGLPLKYHAEVVGSPWQSPPALGVMDENADLSIEARLDLIIRERGPAYFVVTDMNAYPPALHELLLSRFTLLAETPDYVVFDLKGDSP